MHRLRIAALSSVAMILAGFEPVGAQTPPANPPATTPAPATAPAPSAKTEAPPLPGANSFTEAQAKERIEKAGFSDVTALKKDDQGIWRATAMLTGKKVSVALDFKGNVVATQ